MSGPTNIPKINRDDIITAGYLNQLKAGVDANSRHSVAKGHQLNFSGGLLTGESQIIQPLWAEILAQNGKKYEWKRVVEDVTVDGGWKDDPAGMRSYFSHPDTSTEVWNAYEINGTQDSSLVGQKVKLYPRIMDGELEWWFIVSSSSVEFPALLTARTEINNPGWGDSAKTGVFDWTEKAMASGGIWATPAGARSGTYAAGTGAIDAQCTNHGLEYGTKIVHLRPTTSTGTSNSWSYIFDETTTNKDGPYSTP